MKSKKFQVFLIYALFLLTVPAYSQNKKTPVQASWQSTAIIIDGNLSDWFSNNVQLLYDKNSEIAYGIGNDSSNLYLSFRITDEMEKMKALRAGITIKIETTNKDIDGIQIEYPQKSNNGKPENTRGRPDQDQIKKTFKQQPQFMMLSGFATGNGESPLQGINGVTVKLDWTSNNDIVYEIAIPFTSLQEKFVESYETTKVLLLNAEFHAISQNSYNQGGATNGGRPQGSYGGGPGGGGRPAGAGGRPGGTDGDFTKMFEAKKLKVKFQLSKGIQ